MNPLPMAPLKHNECIPRCGACCGGATPVSKEDGERILNWIGNSSPATLKKLTKQLRYWGQSIKACPFLMPDAKCFVYEARPKVCDAFGHVPSLQCPKGATFDPWPDQETSNYVLGAANSLLQEGEATLTYLLGADLYKGMKNIRGGCWSIKPKLYPVMDLHMHLKAAQEKAGREGES